MNVSCSIPQATQALTCDVRPKRHPELEQAEQHTRGWAVAYGLIPPRGARHEGFCRARFGELAARAYPEVTPTQLALVSDWIAFLFAYDDLCDTQRASTPGYARELAQVEERLLALLAGARVHADEHPVGQALADIRERLLDFDAQPWVTRLCRHMRIYIDGCRWERALRRRREIPSLATYMRLRPVISAVAPCFDLAGMCISPRSSALASHTYVAELAAMATNHICWVNDIYGLDKERQEGTTSNLVLVLAAEHGISLREAKQRAVAMCNAEFDAFRALEQLARAQLDASGRAYVDALARWMRGNFDWYQRTDRYELDAPGKSAAASSRGPTASISASLTRA